MCDALCGEFIARAAGRANVWIALVQKPYKGYLVRRRGFGCGVGLNRWKPIDTLRRRLPEPPGWAAKRVRGVRTKVFARFPPHALEGEKPKGASSDGRPKPTLVARDSREG
jgi:hypothetical protein